MASEQIILDSLLHLRDGLAVFDRGLVARILLTLVIFLFACSAGLFIWSVVSWFTSPLRRYPGPFLAGFTNLWRYNLARNNRYGTTIKKLHEKYGPVVRIGPDLLTLDYPELTKTIYSTDGKWLKSNMYKNNCAVVNGKRTFNMFSTQDPVEHAHVKRPIVKFYSWSSVLTMEPHIDKVIADFTQQLDTRFVSPAGGVPPKDVDLCAWITYATWDALAESTFSRRYGYLSAGRDFDSTIAASEVTASYFGTVGQMPWLDELLDKNPVKRLGPPYLANFIGISLENFRARLLQGGEDEKLDRGGRPDDYLQRFIDAKSTHPEHVTDETVCMYIMINILAGADTTAITLQAVLYFVLRHREVWSRLSGEVRRLGLDRDRPVPYSVARGIPYLEACVKEGMRMNPVVGMALERYVPEGGLALPDGSVVPPGTKVGMNPYIAGRNKAVYGPDADEFRPERWMQSDGEDDEAYKERLRRIAASDLSFGGGSRICLGRNLALMEVYKFLATMVNRYDMELSDPEEELAVDMGWMLRPKVLSARLTHRT
ncbi:Pisatin demethylase [Cladorrhinum samala]|uniref:Pisatin demethylase n=1 Tax=Cladorrhinum samala TaxID=585594 RepID=A0AAV9HTR4_9PEZI|nr:Pisatin demethylase [Cladorrhinum samala]